MAKGLIELTDRTLENITDKTVELYKIDAQKYISGISIKVNAQKDILEQYRSEIRDLVESRDRYKEHPWAVEEFTNAIKEVSDTYRTALKAANKANVPGIPDMINGIFKGKW